MDPKIRDYVEQSKGLISTQTEKIAAQEAEIADLKAKMAESGEKTASDASADTKARAKVASETAKILLREGQITPQNLEKFATGLSEFDNAHNFIRNMASELASAQAAPMHAEAVASLNKAASDVESADDAYARLLREANGVA